MKLRKNKESELDFLIKSNSLNDLLNILANICKNLDLDYLDPRTKHFRYFQFTFFGLMVKAKSLLEMLVFRAEFLEKDDVRFNELHHKLLKLKKDMELAYNLIKNKNMTEGKIRIIELQKEYSEIFKADKIKL